MKFIKENTGKGVLVTNAALNMSNLTEGLLSPQSLLVRIVHDNIFCACQ